MITIKKELYAALVAEHYNWKDSFDLIKSADFDPSLSWELSDFFESIWKETEEFMEDHLKDEYGLDDLMDQYEFAEEMINNPYSPTEIIEAYENDKCNKTQKTV
ncbi:MAG: hypothetical protein IKV88_01145 [Clostridia bacterium]|nr:hypothetical protein [Clostridia bacterium]